MEFLQTLFENAEWPILSAFLLGLISMIAGFGLLFYQATRHSLCGPDNVFAFESRQRHSGDDFGLWLQEVPGEVSLCRS